MPFAGVGAKLGANGDSLAATPGHDQPESLLVKSMSSLAQPCWTTVVRRRLAREAADGVQAGGLIDVGVDLLSGRDVLVAEHDLGVPGWDAEQLEQGRGLCIGPQWVHSAAKRRR